MTLILSISVWRMKEWKYRELLHILECTFEVDLVYRIISSEMVPFSYELFQKELIICPMIHSTQPVLV